MRTRGFTLVEMIVSLAVFSIVAVVALTALMSIMSANRKAQTLQSAITNLSYAMESMSRELRVGTRYYCDTGTSFNQWDDLMVKDNCDDVSSSPTLNGAIVAFNSSVSSESASNPTGVCNLIYAYRFIERTDGVEGYDLQKVEQDECHEAPSADFSSVIDSKVVITDFNLDMSNAFLTYPYIRLRMSGYTGDRERDRTYFDLQTAVSARTP